MDDQDQQQLDPSDGGYASRKLWFAVGSAGAVMAGGVAYALVPGFREGYQAFIGGILGTLAIYCGGNVGAKMTIAKGMAALQAARGPCDSRGPAGASDR